jgi:transposase
MVADMNYRTYVYLEADKQLGKKISYYYDHLENAKKAGYSNLVDWIKALHSTYEGNATKTATKIGVTNNTILGWFRRLNLSIKKRGGREPLSHPRRHEVSALIQQGSRRTVAQELGVSMPLIDKWLREDRRKLKN